MSNDMQQEHSLPFSDESSNDTTPDVPNGLSHDLHNHCNEKNLHRDQQYESSLKHSASCVMRPRLSCSKSNMERKSRSTRRNERNSMKLESQPKIKAVSIRKEKTVSNHARQLLEQKVRELEIKQNHLLTQVHSLQLYKEQLERTCKQSIAYYTLE